MLAHRSGAEARDQGQAARIVFGVERGHQPFQVVLGHGRPAFQPDWVGHATAKFHMRTIGLARPVADPDQVARSGYGLACRVLGSAQRFFVFQQQRLVARIEIDAGKLGVVPRGQSGGSDEIKRILDAVRHVAILARLVRVGKTQRPGVDTVHIGETTLGKGAQQVQRGGGLGIGFEHTGRIGDPCLGREVEPVDDVAAIGWQFGRVLRFGRGGSGLGELPCHAPDLYRRHFGAIGQHHRHLKHHLERVADPVGGKFGEGSRRNRRPCNRNASPRDTGASSCLSVRASPAKTSGGNFDKRASTRFRAGASV